MRPLNVGPLAEGAIAIAILALGKPVLVPIALALYFAFVLTPVSAWLERLGLPRTLSVAGIIGSAVAGLGVLGAVLAAQAVDLANQMQAYSTQMSQKLAQLQIGALAGFNKTLSRLGRVLEEQVQPVEEAAPVRVISDDSVLERLDETLRPLIEPLALLGIVLVLTIFVLARREDLRGRLIQLVGPQNVTVTTETINEAVGRISHFLLAQAYINAGFGAVVSCGLYLIGIPYALLWGAAASLLRFVPYLGTLIAMTLPSLVAFAIFPEWHQTVLTLTLFLVVDIAVANFLEPVLLGRRTGVSPVALLISALFWTWLWGPWGLLLSTPLTVCAAVMGRHLPRYAFLTTLLGDDAGLRIDVNFYQRIVARATGDAVRLARRRATETSLAAAFDEVLLPALGMMVRDQNLQAITQPAADLVVKDIDEVIRRLTPPAPQAPTRQELAILGIPAESPADALLLKMFGILVGVGDAFQSLPVIDRAMAIDEAVRLRPDTVCIAALPPSGIVNARFLCRRLRATLPETRIIVLLPAESETGWPEAAARLREAGAHLVAFSLREACDLQAHEAPHAAPVEPSALAKVS